MTEPKQNKGDRMCVKANKIKFKQQEIEVAQNELLELEQEYQDNLVEVEICGSKHPRYTMSNSIKLQAWRIEKLHNQLRQLQDE